MSNSTKLMHTLEYTLVHAIADAVCTQKLNVHTCNFGSRSLEEKAHDTSALARTESAPRHTQAPIEGALKIILEAGIEAIRKKSLKMTSYLMYLIDETPLRASVQFHNRNTKRTQAQGRTCCD